MPTGSARSSVIRECASELNISAVGAQLRLEGFQIAQERPGSARRRAEGVGRDNPGPAGDANLADSRQIHLTVERPSEQAAPVTSVEAVAEQPVPEEGVNMQVNNVALGEE
jgi:hypothetical protein